MSCPHGLFDVCCNDEDNCTLGPSPKREWVGLTDKEYEAMAEQHVTNCYFDTLTYAKAIEQVLKEKNGL